MLMFNFSSKFIRTFTVNPLNVIEESIATKNFASLQLEVPIAKIIGLNGGKISLCILEILYKIPFLPPSAFIFIY